VERVIAAFGRQLDSSAASFTAHEKRTKEVGERVVQETLFALLLGGGFWSPVDETVRGELARMITCRERGKILTRTSRAVLVLRG